MSHNHPAPINYPETKKEDVVDTYFGNKVADPYRWLEDDMSEETAQWVKNQNKVTSTYLEGIPYRDQIKQTLTDLMDYEKIGSPFQRGEYTYFSKMMGYRINMCFIASSMTASLKYFSIPIPLVMMARPL